MGFSFKQQFVILLFVALAPGLTLLLRGLVWGADSFAFWLMACGNNTFNTRLNVSSWFVSTIQSIVSCDLYHLVLIMFLLYLFALCAIWLIGKHFFGSEGWRLPIYLGSLTPLFFLEALRFENDFFGWTIAFIALGLFAYFLDTKKVGRWTLLVYAIPLAILSVLIWVPSVLILATGLFMIKMPRVVKKIVFVALVIAFILLQGKYLIRSFNFTQIVTEELPLVGIIFVIHIIHYYKKIPINVKWWGIFLIVLGLIKSKYMFLATPFLLMGLLDKQLKEGIVLKRRIFGIKELPVLYIALILLVGWTLAGISLYPTQTDMKEMQNAVQLSKDSNITLYNDWGDGWAFESLGYNTKYKISPPEPDWNKLTKPYLAYTKQKLDCVKLNKKTYKCV